MTTASSRAWASTPAAPTQNGQEAKTGTYTGGGKYTIACHQPTQGAIDGGRTAMENCLSANPNINVVYAINEPAAEGAYAALKAAGKQSGVQVYAIDGSCAGLKLVEQRRVHRRRGAVPGQDGRASASTRSPSWPAAAPSRPTSAGQSFFNTGTALVADKPHLRRHEPDADRGRVGLLGQLTGDSAGQ